ncbi:MAG: prepilin-type N-terminal cleavage/methylation domain-containing protein [Scytolyngbya sp. HA4215-MV1]|jgi:prepilin-type N-terminal cleavage/methylation domain-containing protein|nr:prepilin-type N-terminal cleavage/methylation domain-containing protein [Scytolyngbya sp. HA4215-MV1]
MAKQSPRFWFLRRWLKRDRHPTTAGFTLMELLVAMLIGSIITGVMLATVVELLKVNQQESSRAETQQEIQLALDYITADLREAVFVYDGACLSGVPANTVCPGVLNFLPATINTAPNTIPILAFWRVDELPQPLLLACSANATRLYDNPQPAAILDIPCLSRRTYSLVVYYLDTTANSAWLGRSRIRRYELTQFDAQGNRNIGWVDPTLTANNFLGWPRDSANQNLQTVGTLPDGSVNRAQGVPNNNISPPVLADFVDNPIVGTANACPATLNTTNLPTFVRTPTASSNSFYACVRGGGVTTVGGQTSANNPGGRNQEVAIFLRGNAAGKPGVPSTAQVTFEMNTRTLLRGSFAKNPAPQ